MASIWRKGLGGLLAAGVLGGAAFLFITAPDRHDPSTWAGLGEPDLENGRNVFFTGGCASCHAPADASGDARLILSGGAPIHSDFGTFHPPNISSSPSAGIGAWTLAEFGDAMTRGVGRNGEHLYPSFPYTSYSRMTPKDINDLYGFMLSLPASEAVAPAHELPFPFNVRLSLGGWKFLYFSEEPIAELADASELVKRGQYLVEGAGHCGECHTPRNIIGGPKLASWLGGGPNPEGEGMIPNISPGSRSMGSWSEGDIVTYLQTGFTPDYDSVGGTMVSVQKNMAELPNADIEAMAAYLKAIPAVE